MNIYILRRNDGLYFAGSNIFVKNFEDVKLYTRFKTAKAILTGKENMYKKSQTHTDLYGNQVWSFRGNYSNRPLEGWEPGTVKIISFKLEEQ